MLARTVHALNTGFFSVPAKLMVAGESGSLRMPYLFFAIELEDGGFVVVDGGVGHERSSFATALLAWISRGHMPAEWSFARRLEEIGAQPARVRAALVTHLDHDHTVGLPALAERPVYVHRPEWRAAHAKGLFDRVTDRQPLRHLEVLRDVREFDCGRTAGLDLVEGAFDLPEAEGAVTAVSLPGHTTGHVGALVRLEGGGRVLLAGDACYDAAHVVKRRGFGLFPRRVAVDLAAAERSLDALRRWHDAEPDLRIVPSHDPATGRLCEAGPARLGAPAARPAAMS
ncbi:MAG TPA: MBL fold metallo-hydrolase [Planctomycetota bacterium]|nr:MBL fold metallo-hydrolase [Planctomycetota bacterium]